MDILQIILPKKTNFCTFLEVNEFFKFHKTGLKELGDDENLGLEFSNELLLFNISKMRWNKQPLETKGIAPQKRNLHTSVVYKDNLIVFGGKSNGYLNDIHLYSISLTLLFQHF
jgi:hypothetical protein